MTEPTSNVTFFISLVLDGFEKYNETNFQEELPEYSEYTFVADPPAMKRWESVNEYRGGDSMVVYGEEVSYSSGWNELRAPQSTVRTQSRSVGSYNLEYK